MVRPSEENERGAHSEKNARVDIPGKRRKGRPNLRWKDSCKSHMTEMGLKEDNATNRAEWRKKLISYTGDPTRRDKPGTKKKKNKNKKKKFQLVSKPPRMIFGINFFFSLHKQVHNMALHRNEYYICTSFRMCLYELYCHLC